MYDHVIVSRATAPCRGRHIGGSCAIGCCPPAGPCHTASWVTSWFTMPGRCISSASPLARPCNAMPPSPPRRLVVVRCSTLGCSGVGCAPRAQHDARRSGSSGLKGPLLELGVALGRARGVVARTEGAAPGAQLSARRSRRCSDEDRRVGGEEVWTRVGR
jgi:hypothetical protein